MYGLGLYHSLAAQKTNFHLYVVAFDDYTLDILKKLNLPHLTPIALKDFEDEELLKVKPTRTISEYCWTCGSSTIIYCLKHFNLLACTYVDADLCFFAPPDVLIEEMGDKSILLSEHRYLPGRENNLVRGKYCVQFMTFKNNADGIRALSWWREQCLIWCFNRLEDGKFGDQKYLDDWTTRFAGVHVLKNIGGGVASWNVGRYEFFIKNGEVTGKERNGEQEFPLVFYHFHNTQLFNVFGHVIVKGGTKDKTVFKFVYKPYAKILVKGLQKVKKIDASFNSGFAKNRELFVLILKESIPGFIKKPLKTLLKVKSEIE